jgi:hypothetical protein
LMFSWSRWTRELERVGPFKLLFMCLLFALVLACSSYEAITLLEHASGPRLAGNRRMLRVRGNIVEQITILQPGSAAAVDAAPAPPLPQPPCMNCWLYTLIGADYPGTADLLPHWLGHYLGPLGFARDRLIVVVNNNSTRPEAVEEFRRVKELLELWQVPYSLWLDRYSSDAHLKIKLQTLMERNIDAEDWITIADADEFHGYIGGAGPTITALTAAAEAAGSNFVMGQMIDRVAANGELAEVHPGVHIFRQFPLNCQVVRRVAGGYPFKVVAFKAHWRTNTGNHFLVTPDRAKKYFSAAASGTKNARGGWMGADDVWDLTPYSWYEDRYRIPGAAVDPGSRVYVPRQHKDFMAVFHMKWHKGVMQVGKVLKKFGIMY